MATCLRQSRFVLLLALLVLASSCAGSSQASTANPALGSIDGKVTAGPTCPVERPGQDCAPRPVADLVIRLRRSHHTVATAHTSKTGHYAFHALRAGSYTLVPGSDAVGRTFPARAVRVLAGSSTRVDIAIDSGIR